MTTRRIITLALALGIMLGAAAPASMPSASAATCYGAGCNDRDADIEGCGNRSVARSNYLTVGQSRVWLILWYSSDCRAVWSEITYPSPGYLYTAVKQGSTEKTTTAKSCNYCTRVKSLMHTAIWTPNLYAFGNFRLNGGGGAFQTTPGWYEP